MTDAKSYLAARNLRDIFAGLGWGPWQITALACEMPDRVIIQYRSEELGETRQVMADPLPLDARRALPPPGPQTRAPRPPPCSRAPSSPSNNCRQQNDAP